MRTNQDVQAVYCGTPITIPAGTAVKAVPSSGGRTLFAVVSVKLLIDLTGNTHDPKYRYCFVPADAVAA